MPPTINIATSLDENYAIGSLVMIKSLLVNLDRSTKINLFLFEDNLDEETKLFLERTWTDRSICITWLCPQTEGRLDNVRMGGYAGVQATYYRLFIGDLLPANVNRVIYLDADLVIDHDISELWRLDVSDCVLRAVQDGITPYAQCALPHMPDDVDATALIPYFNAGLMLINLENWRRENIGDRALAAARTYQRAFRYWDQDALNYCLIGRWENLSPCWNRATLWDAVPDDSYFPYSAEQLVAARKSPRVIHCLCYPKHWHFPGSTQAESRFFHYLDMTALHGWRPRATRFEHMVETLARRHRTCVQLLSMVRKAAKAHRAPARYVPYVFCQFFRYPWTILSVPLHILLSPMHYRGRRVTESIFGRLRKQAPRIADIARKFRDENAVSSKHRCMAANSP